MKRHREEEKEDHPPTLPLEIWQEIFGFMGMKDVFKWECVHRCFTQKILYESIRVLNTSELDRSLHSKSNQMAKFINTMSFVSTDGGYRWEPDVLLSFHHLVSLKIRDTILYCPQIELLTSLRSLVVVSNPMCAEYEAPIGLSCLIRLEKLDVPGSCIIRDTSLYRLTNLTHLSMQDHDNDLMRLSSLTRLEFIDIGSNRYDNVPVKCRFPPSLEYLRFRNSMLDDTFSGLTNLTSLNIGQSCVFELRCLEQMTNLTALSLYRKKNSNEVLDILLPHSLKKIQVAHMEIGDTLSRLTNLESLECFDGAINGYSLKSLSHLTEIYIEHARFDGHMDICSLTNLSTLVLRGSSIPITDNDLVQLTKLEFLELSEVGEPLMSITSHFLTSLSCLKTVEIFVNEFPMAQETMDSLSIDFIRILTKDSAYWYDKDAEIDGNENES